HLRIELVHDVQLVSPESKQFELAVLLNLQADRIEIRELPTGRIPLPVIWIAAQQHVLAWLVFTYGKPPQHCCLLARRVGRENRDLVELSGQCGHRPRKSRHYGGRPRTFGFQGAGYRTETVAHGGVQSRVHQLPECENDILTRKERAVGEK